MTVAELIGFVVSDERRLRRALSGRGYSIMIEGRRVDCFLSAHAKPRFCVCGREVSRVRLGRFLALHADGYQWMGNPARG